MINGVTSEWALATSGVPQNSIIATVLFIVYIRDTDVGVNNLISKFVKDKDR